MWDGININVNAEYLMHLRFDDDIVLMVKFIHVYTRDLRERVRNEPIRQTKVTDIVQTCSKLKWQRADHICRRSDNRWSKKVLEWRRWLGKRSAGRLLARWTDDLRMVAGSDWMAKASDKILYLRGSLRPAKDCFKRLIIMMMIIIIINI